MLVKVALNIPSGKLVCGNDFRDLYRDDRFDVDFDVNETVGIKQTIEEYGRRGLFHGFCGNSCPGLYLDGNKLSIASLAWDKEKDEPIKDDSLGKEIGSICTDLWWYSVADYDDFVSRGGKLDKRGDTVIDVEPGRYVLVHDLDVTRDYNKLELFATIKKSNEQIIPWKLPEEDAAKEIMALLPDRFLATKVIDNPPPKGCDEDYVRFWKDKGYDKHTIKTRLHVKTAYEAPEVDDYITPWKKIGYTLWGSMFDGEVKTFIRNVTVTAEQLLDRKYMAELAVEAFEKEKLADVQRKLWYGRSKEDMTDEEGSQYIQFLKEETETLTGKKI